MKNRKLIYSLILNLAIVIMELIAASISWRNFGTGMFIFYTEDSNLLALAVCAVYSVFLIRSLTGAHAIPRWALMLKYTASCCLALTFLVVVCVLAPMQGGAAGYVGMLFTGSMLYSHFLCPVLAVLSCLFFDPDQLPGRRAALYALIPTALYAAVTIVLNLCRLIEGPYPFLLVYQQSWWASVLWCIAIVGGAYLICLGLFSLRRRARAPQQA